MTQERSDRRVGPDPRASRSVPQKRGEGGDEFISDQADEVIDDGDDALSSPRTSIAEQYLHKHLQIWVYFELGCVVREPYAWLAVLEGIGANPSEFAHAPARGLRPVGERVSSTAASGGSGGKELTAMLVDNVQLVQESQPLARVRSLVRLYSVDPLPNSGRHVELETWLLGTRAGIGPELSAPDGEGRLVRTGAMTDADEMTCEVVEGATEVVDAVAERNHEVVGHGRGLDRVIGVLQSFTFNLERESVETELTNPINDRLECLLVSLCAPHLEVYGVKIDRLRPVTHSLTLENHAQDPRDPEDHKGLRDPNPDPERILRGAREGRQEAEAPTGEAPGEVATRTEPDHLNGGCSARRTRSGSPENA